MTLAEGEDAYTYLLKADETWCLSGQRLPSGQCPCMYALHTGRSGSRPKRYSRRRKSLKLKSYVAWAACSMCSSGAAALCTSVIAWRESIWRQRVVLRWSPTAYECDPGAEEPGSKGSSRCREAAARKAGRSIQAGWW